MKALKDSVGNILFIICVYFAALGSSLGPVGSFHVASGFQSTGCHGSAVAFYKYGFA